jgi:phenylpyruvate tautomerase PptA (4-oxalocrotonate tautomerase family)
MPYIAVNTSGKLPEDKQEKIKAEFGRLIGIIPTKTEAGLLVDFSGGRVLYKGGAKVNGAFVEIRLFHRADFEAKKKFTEEVFALFSRELDIEPGNMYLTILEFDSWGTGGTLKQ